MLELDIAYLQAKFDHSSFSRSGDMVGARYFLFFSRPRSDGWPHHGRTLSSYL